MRGALGTVLFKNSPLLNAVKRYKSFWKCVNAKSIEMIIMGHVLFASNAQCSVLLSKQIFNRRTYYFINHSLWIKTNPPCSIAPRISRAISRACLYV